MVNSGELAELVNADKVNLTNQTDNLTFGQLHNLRWSDTSPIHKRTSIDKTLKQYAGQKVITISGDILITTPEITTFVGFRNYTNGQLPNKNWDLELTGINLILDTVRIFGFLSGLDFIRPQKGGAWFHVEIANQTEVVSEP